MAMRMSTILELLYETVISQFDTAIDDGECPNVNVFYKNNDNDGESFVLTISDIDIINNIIKVTNESGVSLGLQGINLSNREINSSITKDALIVKDHLNYGGSVFGSDDELELVGDISSLQIGEELSLSNPHTVYLKSDILNLSKTSYANTRFYKTEAFILSLIIKTRNDDVAFEVEDITDTIKDMFDDYPGNIILNDGVRDYTIMILDNIKVFDDYEESTALQKRTVKIMLGYNVVNTKYTSK